MSGLRLSRQSATFVTFLLSALCHELVMAVVTKKIRPYLFLMQVGVPLDALGYMRGMKGGGSRRVDADG
jgi:sterol O-acyltransferase